MSRFYYAYIKLKNDIDSHIADMNNPHKVTASQVPLTDSGGYYSSTDIEGALQEIGSGTTLDGRYVLKAGDTMAGALQISLSADGQTLFNATTPGATLEFSTLSNDIYYEPYIAFGGGNLNGQALWLKNSKGSLRILPWGPTSSLYLQSSLPSFVFSSINDSIGTFVQFKFTEASFAGFLSLVEMTPPTAPAANQARIYIADDGSGLTEFRVVFNTGDPLVLGVQGLTVPTYTVSNVTVTRTLDPTTATLSDVANVLATLIQDLQARRLIKPYI